MFLTTHHFQASESPSETLPSFCVPPSTASGSIPTESSPDDDCEDAGDVPSTTHGRDSVATTPSSSGHGFPSGAPSQSLPAVNSTIDGSSSTHTYGVSALASMKKHGKGQSFTSSQAITGGLYVP